MKILHRVADRGLAGHAGRGMVALVGTAILVACVFVFPRWLYLPLTDQELDQISVTGRDRDELEGERLNLQNEARTTLLQGLGGAVVLLGAWIATGNLR